MTNNIWERNLKAMDKWYSVFADIFRNKSYESDDVLITTEISLDDELIFRVEKDGQKLYLEGKRNTKQPIEIWLERIGNINKQGTVVLLGIGNASYLKAIIEHTKSDVNIVVYEPSVNIFVKVLQEIDISKEIEDRPIAFIVEGINENEYEPVIVKTLDVENMEALKVEVHPNYKEFFGELIIKRVKFVQQRTEETLVQVNTGVKFSADLAHNVLRNMKYILEGYHPKKLAESFSNKDVGILVSAGPSLNKNIRELKRAKNKAFILAVDTAIKPLLKEGIVPDAFVTIDALKPLHLMEGAEEIPVIAPSCAVPDLMDHQKGRKIFYYDGYAIPMSIYLLNGKVFSDSSTGGSVACSGFSILYKIGFKTIILVGQDLAFTGNKSHADGTFHEKMPEEDTRGMTLVKGNYEEKVPTRQDLKIFLHWFENYIEKTRAKGVQYRVVNATEGGAYIEGTEISTLKDILDEVCNNKEDVFYSKELEQMESEFTPEDRERAIKYLHNVPKEFDDIIKGATELKKVYNDIQKQGRAGNMNKDKIVKLLKKVKKLTESFSQKPAFQLIEVSTPLAEYLIRSELFHEEKTIAKDLEEVGRKGILYCKMVIECAEILKEVAEDNLLSI